MRYIIMSIKTWKKVAKVLIALLLLSLIVKIYVDRKIGSIKVPSNAGSPAVTLGEEVTFLNLPDGMKAYYYAKNIPGARVMEWDPKGRMLVSQTKEGTISVLEDVDNDGVAEKATSLIEKLDSPHGMAIICDSVGNPPCHLYVAEHDELSRYTYDAEEVKVSEYTKLIDLPKSVGDRHSTRTILHHGDSLLISIGSSCNVCEESDELRGKIISYNIETKETSEFATGLRNAVFMTKHPVDGNIWLTEMGRDGLGDNVPPDEINVIDIDFKGVPNFGWPICYGANIHDTEFDSKTYIRNPCMEPFEIPPVVSLQAHVAPLGLSFIPEEGWPENLWFDLLVVEHGSWNRSDPVGYKIEKIDLNSRGEFQGAADFITGWLTPKGEKLGRPADIKVMPGGVIYISDDMSGLIYKVVSTEIAR